MRPAEVAVERLGAAFRRCAVGGVRAGAGAQQRKVEAQRVAVGQLEGGRRVHDEQAVAAAAVDVAEALAVDLVLGHRLGEGGAGRLALRDETLDEAEPAPFGPVGQRAGEAGHVHDLAGCLGDAACARDQRAAVRELALRVAEQQVQRERAAEGVARRLGVREAGDALGGEAVEIGRVRGLERGPAAELRDRPVAEAVEEDDEQAHRLSSHRRSSPAAARR